MKSFESTAGLVAEAVTAVNRTVVVRLEGNLAGVATLGANRVKHLTGCTRSITARILAVGTAALASLGLVGEALLCVKFLLAGSKGEFLSAIFADQSFVAVHR